ncbi:MAG: hypothetical protein ACRCS9_05850 [Hyphomicrobium sp.]
MKFAAYTNDAIWGVGATADEARTEAIAALQDMEVSMEEAGELKVAPIDAELEAALSDAEETGDDVLFDLVDGRLVLDEEAEEDEEAA